MHAELRTNRVCRFCPMLIYWDRVLSERSGHSYRCLGKYGPIGAQRPKNHRVCGLRLSIDSHGSEQTWRCTCICLKLWIQEICVLLQFSVSESWMPLKNSWALHCFMAEFDHSSFGRESLLHAKLVLWAIFSYCDTVLIKLWKQHKPVWPSVRLVSRGTSVRIRFGSPFSSKAVVCGHCTVSVVTLSLTINETLKWLSSLPILMQKLFWWWLCSDMYEYIISLSPPPPPPPPPCHSVEHQRNLSHVALICVSGWLGVKHQVKLLTYCQLSDSFRRLSDLWRNQLWQWFSGGKMS